MIRQTGIFMFHSVKPPVISFVLVVATILAGVVPVAGACEMSSVQCGVKQCRRACCTKTIEPADLCCSTFSQLQACRCSVENQRPATPQERRTSDERDASRRAGGTLAVIFVGDDEILTLPIKDGPLFSSLPATRRQAILCLWLS